MNAIVNRLIEKHNIFVPKAPFLFHGVIEISGLMGQGRVDFILPIIKKEVQSGRVVGIIDPINKVYPIGLGANLERILIVRPQRNHSFWVTEQLISTLKLVVLVDPPSFGLSGNRFLSITQKSRSSIIILNDVPDPYLIPQLRFTIKQNRIISNRGLHSRIVIS